MRTDDGVAAFAVFHAFVVVKGKRPLAVSIGDSGGFHRLATRRLALSGDRCSAISDQKVFL
jgi:hypothetical protein